MLRLFLVSALALCSFTTPLHAKPLRIATFEADVTPPIGAPLCDALVPPARQIDDPLTARGLILFGTDKPIVLCALDWVGVGNTGHDAFRDALAKAAGTTRERVCVHCLHQHDPPGCAFLSDELLAPYGLHNRLFDTTIARKAIDRVAAAAAKPPKDPRDASHVGIGEAKREQVASTRR